MSRSPEPVAGAPGSSRRADMAPVPRNPYAGRQINDLHRDILVRFLSHLDARQAVQTCVVSLKWRDLWRDVQRLHFSHREFEIPGDDDYDARSRWFKKFVNRLLMLRNRTSLEEFRLSYNLGPDPDNPADSAEPSLWIRHALLCNARSVEVIVWEDRLELDHAGLTAESLTSLRFDTVVLYHGFFRQLQTGCQALKCLILQNCPIDDTEIFSQTLKFLSIERDCSFDYDDQTSISAPNLTHFGFFSHGYYNRIPLLKNLESLETAYISLDVQKGIQVGHIRQFLKGLSGVTTLEFYYAAPQLEMANNLQWCPTFRKLKFLTLGRWCLRGDYYALIVVLQNSSNLVKLTLQLKEHGSGFIGELGKGSFTCEHLNIVEIICVERDQVVNSLEKFLLASGITPGQIYIKH
ncbi:hypothetical protein QOZ80_1BG0070840 [Eleusine coracana subsp. coracana]|nr:hypothetical protein QOZ80_1BG0070840 [Eleusine coracana subsp. coracana]